MGPAQIAALENCGIKVENYDNGNGVTFRDYETIDLVKPDPLEPTQSNIHYEDPLAEASRLPNYQNVGNIIDTYLAWRGKNYMIKMFFPSVKKPSRREVQDQVRKVYPGCKLWNYQVSEHEPGEPILQTTGGR